MICDMKKVVVIAGTRRPGNYTSRAARTLAGHLAELDLEIDFIDGRDLTLNFPGEGETEDAKRLKSRLEEADAVVLATPEYHGSPAAFVKLILENLGHPSPLKSKPVSLLGVAAGRIGAIKSLEMLRSICAHIGAFVLPGAHSIAGVDKLFDDDGNCTDEETDERLARTAKSLRDYLVETTCTDHDLERDVREGDGRSDRWSASM